eukprot:2530404-Prorocentrum_lima.AAC.1
MASSYVPAYRPVESDRPFTSRYSWVEVPCFMPVISDNLGALTNGAPTQLVALPQTWQNACLKSSSGARQ